MSLETNKLQELLDTVRTERVVDHFDDGDNWDIPIYNTPERIEAAEKLASAGATEGLSAIQGFFVKHLLEIQIWIRDDKCRSDIRRLAKALIILGGEESFSSMMLTRVMPALEAIACKESYAWEKQLETLSFLVSEFGRIGDWDVQVTNKIVNERSLGTQRIQELIDRVRKPELRRTDWGAWLRVSHREMGRQAAAAELAFARATEALEVLQDVFVEAAQVANFNIESHLIPNRCRDIHGFANALLVLGRVDAFDSMMITRVIPALEVEATKKGYYSLTTIHMTEMCLSFLRSAFGNIGNWEASTADRLACIEESLRRRTEDVKIQAQAYAKKKAEEEQRILTIQQQRRAQRQCIMCGRRLKLIHRLQNAEKHPECKSFKE